MGRKNNPLNTPPLANITLNKTRNPFLLHLKTQFGTQEHVFLRFLRFADFRSVLYRHVSPVFLSGNPKSVHSFSFFNRGDLSFLREQSHDLLSDVIIRALQEAAGNQVQVVPGLKFAVGATNRTTTMDGGRGE